MHAARFRRQLQEVLRFPWRDCYMESKQFYMYQIRLLNCGIVELTLPNISTAGNSNDYANGASTKVKMRYCNFLSVRYFVYVHHLPIPIDFATAVSSGSKKILLAKTVLGSKQVVEMKMTLETSKWEEPMMKIYHRMSTIPRRWRSWCA